MTIEITQADREALVEITRILGPMLRGERGVEKSAEDALPILARHRQAAYEQVAADFDLLDSELCITSRFIGNGCRHGFKPAKACPNENCKQKALHLAAERLSGEGSEV